MVNKSHRLAQQNRLEIKALAGERLLVRPYSGEHERLAALLRESGIDNPPSHQMAVEDDIVTLLEANAGIAILPRSARRSESIRVIEVNGLDLDRTVYLYEVAGRRHLPAVAGLVRIIRARDMSRSLAS